MIKFRDYYNSSVLLEAKNTQSDSAKHLSHLEDLAIEDGKSGYLNFLEQITEIVNFAKGLNSTLKINLKVDGAPAIMFGSDPEMEGAFFVAHKSRYDRGMLAYTQEDVARIYAKAPGLAAKMSAALDKLRAPVEAVGSGLVYHGDMLWSDDSEKVIRELDTSIDVEGQRISGTGREYITFQPQLLMYAVPVDNKTDLYRQVNKASFGISVHDSFKPSLGSNSKSPASLGTVQSNKNVEDLVQAGDDSNVFVAQSHYNPGSVKISFPASVQTELANYMKKIEYHISEVEDEFDQEYTNAVGDAERGRVVKKDFYSIVKQFLNNEVRNAEKGKADVYSKSFQEGVYDPDMFRKRFYAFLKTIYDKTVSKANSLKTSKGKEKAVVRAKATLSQFEATLDDPSFQQLVIATHYMIQVKRVVVQMFSDMTDDIKEGGGKIGKSYVDMDGQWHVHPGEGFVFFVNQNHTKIMERVPLDTEAVVGGFSTMNLAGAGKFQK